MWRYARMASGERLLLLAAVEKRAKMAVERGFLSAACGEIEC
jgi:hypothetical protein